MYYTLILYMHDKYFEIKVLKLLYVWDTKNTHNTDKYAIKQ